MKVFCLILDHNDLDDVMAMRAYTRAELADSESLILDTLYSSKVELIVSHKCDRITFLGSAEKRGFLAWARGEMEADLAKHYDTLTSRESHMFNDKYMECLKMFGR